MNGEIQGTYVPIDHWVNHIKIDIHIADYEAPKPNEVL